ncbi:MAG: permease [Desulfobacteraceae bacterium]|jgi:uncharacterized membrane protein YraQ (UPF0718 family)
MKKKLNPMIVPTVILGVIASVLLFYGYQKGSHIKGLNNAFVMTVQVLPLMFFSFIIAGMMQVLVSGEALLAWVGPEAGMKGIFLGTLAGAVTPGGPFVCLPLIAGFIHSGAGIGTMVAFITSWSIWAVMRLPLEIGILGLEFTLVRLASSALLPVIAGVFAQYFFSWVTIVQK